MFQVCKNPSVKCAVVEQVRGTTRDRLYKNLTYKNTNTYIDVLPTFVKSYNDKVHKKTGMAPLRVSKVDVLAIWHGWRPRGFA